MLVERVDNLTPETDWGRAYAEIEEFQEQLTDHGIVLAKYWLHITNDEQQRRFEQRNARYADSCPPSLALEGGWPG